MSFATVGEIIFLKMPSRYSVE